MTDLDHNHATMIRDHAQADSNVAYDAISDMQALVVFKHTGEERWELRVRQDDDGELECFADLIRVWDGTGSKTPHIYKPLRFVRDNLHALGDALRVHPAPIVGFLSRLLQTTQR